MKAWIDYTNNIFKNDSKISSERAKYKIYCSKCGHGTVFYPMEHKSKKICSWCGYYVYKDKKEEFKERLGVLL
jgi:ribosomal protein S27AE